MMENWGLGIGISSVRLLQELFPLKNELVSDVGVVGVAAFGPVHQF